MTTATSGPRDVARATGISTDTLRHYEKQGLLPGVTITAAGYRQYSAATPADGVVVALCDRADAWLTSADRDDEHADDGAQPLTGAPKLAVRGGALRVMNCPA